MGTLNSSAAPVLAPVRAQSLSQLAYESISQSILSGQFGPGMQLKENVLASQLGMSRGPIREAFKRLADEHLVHERPRHGVFVRELTAADIAGIYNVRVAVESIAARLFVRAKADVTPLRQLIDKMRAGAGRHDAFAVVDAEVRFHEAICRGADSEYVLAVYQRMRGPIHLAMMLDDSTYSTLDDIASEHEPVVTALAAGDEQETVEVISRHIMLSVAAMIERLGGDPARLLA